MSETESIAETVQGMPRWVKVTLIIIAAVAVLFLVAKATGLGGEHGPGRHGGGQRPPVERTP